MRPALAVLAALVAGCATRGPAVEPAVQVALDVWPAQASLGHGTFASPLCGPLQPLGEVLATSTDAGVRCLVRGAPGTELETLVDGAREVIRAAELPKGVAGEPRLGSLSEVPRLL